MDAEEEKENSSENYAVKAVQSYIRNNPEKDLSLGALSDRFRINPSYLSRVFHQETGIPPFGIYSPDQAGSCEKALSGNRYENL